MNDLGNHAYLDPQPHALKEIESIIGSIEIILTRSPKLSAQELIIEIKQAMGVDVCWSILANIKKISHHPRLFVPHNQYLKSLLDSQSLENALLRLKVKTYIIKILQRLRQPSAKELLSEIEGEIGIKARWHIFEVVSELCVDASLTHFHKDYLKHMLDDGTLINALAGGNVQPPHNVDTGIDLLLSQSQQYRQSSEFQKMIEFMALFRDYAPYNSMLVRVQNPSCSFYASASDWKNRFERTLIEDARPMLILAPMHPVMLVYDVDQTKGKELPEELNKFSRFEGEWNSKWLENIIENAFRHRIRIDKKKLSSTNSGFATFSRQKDQIKMRIAIHDELDLPSQFGVICHELAHIFLGHLGSDKDLWWPSRVNLPHQSIEIEAEAVAFIVTNRLGLKGSSASYISRYLSGNVQLPDSVSVDYVAKTAGKLERMAQGLLPEPKEKPSKQIKKKVTNDAAK